MLKAYHGSCHCKRVQFDVNLDVSRGIHKCNCTYCVKTKYQKVFTKADQLTLKTGEDSLTNYHASPSGWPEGHIHHYFCKNCGVQVYSKGYLEMPEHDIFNGWFYAVNLATIDNVTPEEIISAPVIYEDGINDNQLNPPKETRHL
ncbi:aldehyde-activating protein [Bdellovibrio bacteriovorus]|uniref:Aldehyde-activating protein n=1 Tax=Bdellovibrio bacteriovorus TaxID=959 RepID=A0A150WC89_BDEBC|nr:GFA family protein [Bdellovibrio bacteriovorus]KYG60563.1 aldehyde-activating protein [Bdellovibrio bacteriovorus]